MPPIEFFSQFGIFFERNFVEESFRRTYCHSLLSNKEFSKGTVVGEGDQGIENEEWRKVLGGTVGANIQDDLSHRLTILQSRLEQHFRLNLHWFEPPQFLLYQAGDFYRHHQDVLIREGDEHFTKRRRVSLVLFLNGQGGNKETDFAGGSLSFYGLVKSKSKKYFGIPIQIEPGLLVAFPSGTFHEVLPVTQGQRMSVVTFYS